MRKLKNLIFPFAILSVSSCQKKNPQQTTLNPPVKSSTNSLMLTQKSADFSDEDLFKAAIFLSGNAVKLMGDFQSLSPDNINGSTGYVATFQNSLIAIIKRSDPAFFINFRKDITSGDENVIKEQLIKSVSVINNATAIMIGEGEIPDNSYAINYINDIKSRYNLTDNSSIEEMQNAMKDLVNSDGKSSTYKKPDWLYVDRTVAFFKGGVVWAYVGVFVMAVYVVPVTFEPNTNQAVYSFNTGGLLAEEYLSTVVANFAQ